MSRLIPLRSILATLVLAGAALVATDRASAAEEVQAFIEGLKERGLHEYALLYMDQMKDSPLAPAEFKKNLAYEQGVTMIDYARRSGDSKVREEMFEQARRKLEAFSKSNSGDLLGAKANTQLANLLVERGRSLLLRSELPSQAANKDALLTEARKFFDDAEKVFKTSESFYSEALKDKERFPANLATDNPAYEVRQEFRGELVQSRLLIATVIAEKAKTYAPGTDKNKELLTEAAKQYGEMYEKYRQWLAGLYARLYQGRAHKDLKDYKTALSYYEDLLIQPADVPAFRTLLTKTYIDVGECYNAQKNWDECIEKLGDWVNTARGTEDRQTDWLAVKFELAKAHVGKARGIDPKTDGKTMRRELKSGRDVLKDIVRYPSDIQRDAKQLLAELGSGGADEDEDPETFDEAFDLAKENIDLMQATGVALKILQSGGGAAEDPAAEVAKLEKQIVEARAKALKYFRVALGLVEEDTNVDRLNLVRYYLCYLYWEEKQYYDAAILGEFLAYRYPDSTGARSGAKIAMAAYLSEYNNPTNASKDFDADKVVEIAKFMIRRWPGGPEAAEANKMLVTFMLQRDDVPRAIEYFGQLSDSPQKAASAVSIGQKSWAMYIQALRMEDGDPAKPSAAEMEALKTQAQTMLQQGLTGVQGAATISNTVANAALSLSQIYLDTSQYEKAIELLEDSTIGPLTLLKSGHAATKREGYPEETYKAALRSYVSVIPPQQEKADGIMDALEAHVGMDSESAEKLTRIFIGLGLQLQEQMKTAVGEKREADAQALAKSFEAFLGRISERGEGNNWATRNWIASTYYNLGAGVDTGAKVTAQAKDYYDEAAGAYKTILAEVKAGKITPPKPDSVLGVEMRLAEVEMKTGDYRSALDRLAEVLETKPMMLDAQMMAAEAYQERGIASEAKWLGYAIKGGRKSAKTGQNRIWGWGKLAQITARYPKYRNVFHEARYNLAKSRFEYAKKQSTAADKTKYYEYAKRDISFVVRLFPDLGDWRDEYDDLLKDIQQALKEKPVGLKEFKSTTPVTASQ
jgi:hypothetical protein